MKFNILMQPWLPVITKSGTAKEVSVLTALQDAHKFRCISEPSPLVEFSMHRFLVTFLMDALRPSDVFELKCMLFQKKFDMDRIHAYIRTCEEEGVSFDLFDEKRPFLQSVFKEKEADKKHSAVLLDFARASGTNTTWYDHPGSKDDAYTPAEALRYMLTTYVFATSGGSGYKCGINGVPPLYTLVKGDNLYETLVNNLVPVPSDNFDNRPVLWRRTEEVGMKVDRTHTSFLEGMIYPSRKIQLLAGEDGLVRDVCFAPGEACKERIGFKDPNVTLNAKNQFLMPAADMPVWQNLCQVLDVPGGTSPTVVSVYAATHMDRTNMRLTLYGTLTSKAKYATASRHDYKLPASICRSGNRLVLMHVCASYLSELAKTIKYYATVLPYISNKKAGSHGAVTTCVEDFMNDCWAHYEVMCRTSTDSGIECEAQRKEFKQKAANEACRAFDRLIWNECNSAKSLRMVAEQQCAFQKSVYKWLGKEARKKGKEKESA